MLRMKMVIGETFLLYSGCAVCESEMISSSLEGGGAEFLELFESEVNGREFSG